MKYQCLIAPAKINLNLAILSRRPDSYHEILSLIQSVSLHDSLYVKIDKKADNYYELENSIDNEQLQSKLKLYKIFSAINYRCDERQIDNLKFNEIKYKYQRKHSDFNLNKTISFDVDVKIVSWVNKLEARDNILCKVINSYFDLLPNKIINTLDIKKIEIILLKKIPFMSGLGGGSSDAASLIKFLDKNYNFMNESELIEFSKKIGADVPFFLFSASRICSGIGENIKNFYHLKSIPCLILKPKESVSTKQAFLDYDLEWQALSDYDKKKLMASKQVSAQVFFSKIRDYYKNVKLNSDKGKLSLNVIEDFKEKLSLYGFNDFYPLIKKQNNIFTYIDKLLKNSGAFYSNLTGSGSAFFALYDSEDELKSAYNKIINSEFRNYMEFLIACETT